MRRPFALLCLALLVAADAPPEGVSPVVVFVIDHFFELLATTILPAVFLWVRTHTRGTAFESSTVVVEEFIRSRIALVKPLIIDALRNDGRIDNEEMVRIRDAVTADLPAAIIAPLRSSLGAGFLTWLEGSITRWVAEEARLESNKAGAAAAAKVTDVEKAEAILMGAPP